MHKGETSGSWIKIDRNRDNGDEIIKGPDKTGEREKSQEGSEANHHIFEHYKKTIYQGILWSEKSFPEPHFFLKLGKVNFTKNEHRKYLKLNSI